MDNGKGRLKISRFIFWVFLFYFFIFQPPVLPKILYLAIQVAVAAFLVLLAFRRVYSFLYFFRVELTLVLGISVYSLIRDLFVSEVVYSDRFLGWFFQAYLISGLLVLFYHFQRPYSLKDDFVCDEIYVAILLAALITCLLYFLPSFDSFYESIQFDEYYERYSAFEKRYRAYGISENLTFTYAVVLGLGAGYSLFLVKRSWLFLFLCPVFVFAISINARVGFLAFIFFVLFIFFRAGLKGKLVWIFSGLLVVFSVFVYFDQFIQDNLWNFGFFLDVADFVVNGLEGDNVIAVLIKDHVVLPEGLLEVVFGSGQSVYSGDVSRRSDIGYIIQLNYGGITLIALLLLVVGYMSLRLFKVLGYRHWYSWFFPFSILALNFKGFIFAMTPGGRILILLYIFFIFRAALKRRVVAESLLSERAFSDGLAFSNQPAKLR